MKKMTVYDLFLIFTVIFFVGTRNIYSGIMLLIAGALELIDVIPKIIKEIRNGSE